MSTQSTFKMTCTQLIWKPRGGSSIGTAAPFIFYFVQPCTRYLTKRKLFYNSFNMF